MYGGISNNENNIFISLLFLMENVALDILRVEVSDWISRDKNKIYNTLANILRDTGSINRATQINTSK